MSRNLSYTIEAQDLPSTLGAYLRRKGYSEKLLARLRREDRVRVNEEFHRMIDPIALGDAVEVCLEDQAPPLIPNPKLNISILYEDEDLVVLDKPADMLVHPAGKGFDDALANFCAARYPRQLFRPVGRLDRNTTGACLIAKTKLTASLLSGDVDKDYLALAEGLLAAEEGLIDAPLLRVPGTTIRRRVDPAGQPSQTRFRLLQSFPKLGPNGHSWLRLKLLTGRTHQIRAHMAYLGHPLAGDSLYGGSTELIGRHALHCAVLRFRQPVTGEELEIRSPLPPDLQQLLQQAGGDIPV